MQSAGCQWPVEMPKAGARSPWCISEGILQPSLPKGSRKLLLSSSKPLKKRVSKPVAGIERLPSSG